MVISAIAWILLALLFILLGMYLDLRNKMKTAYTVSQEPKGKAILTRVKSSLQPTVTASKGWKVNWNEETDTYIIKSEKDE